jgi:hypothetical protein
MEIPDHSGDWIAIIDSWQRGHGGSIEVETEPGEFAEIRVILPRAAALLPEGPISPRSV